MTLLVACGSGEIITHTVTETQNQSSTQIDTLIEKQTDTITISTTVNASSPPTTTPPITMSTPATNSEPATFSVSDMTIEPRVPTPGKSFTTSVTVTNNGGSQGSHDVILYIHKLDFQVPENPIYTATTTYTENVIIAAGESIMVTFPPFISDDGVYALAIDELVDYLEIGNCTY